MTTSSEDVLLSIAHVRYKKGDGTFYVMNQRLAWMVENRDTVAVSHRFADIKTQKISPAGKAKIQLQVVLHDGGCSTFHFANPAGASAAEEDRDRVKQLLQSLLPKFRRQVDRELEEKSRLLSLHPVLKHLYEDLVITKVMNSEEYWNTPTLKQYTESQTVKQDVGVSGAFLADIQPQTDGCNGLKYNLTQDIIDAIFKTYPAVRKKHQDHVPNKMTEAEFWTKFFQSHYFHRYIFENNICIVASLPAKCNETGDQTHLTITHLLLNQLFARNLVSPAKPVAVADESPEHADFVKDRISSASSKDLFGECARLDDVAIAHAMKSSEPDMTVDLPRFTEQTPLLPPEEESKGDGGSIHRNMIKRFNQHSIMVLKASQKSTNSSAKSKHTPEENGVTLNGKVSDGKNKTKPTASSTEASPAKKRRILDQIHYEDLEGDNSNDIVEPELVLSKIERYLLGPSSSNTSSAKSPELPPVSVLTSVCQAWSSGLSGSRPTRVAPAAAVGALGELSPGGLLMRHHISTSMAQLIPPEVWTELRRLYLSCGEVLRQLWRCFPSPGAPEPDSALQADQLYEALVRFRHARLQPFEDRMHRELSTIAPTLTRHLNEMIDIAVNKYVTWQQRQAKLR